MFYGFFWKNGETPVLSALTKNSFYGIVVPCCLENGFLLLVPAFAR